jgi:hypothetical protein
MSEKVRGNSGLVSVKSPSDLAEISVLDPAFHVLAIGAESLEKELYPGIYRVQARVPGSLVERLISVEPGQTTVVTGFDLRPDTAIPLAGRPSTPASHVAAAQEQSRHVHVTAGAEGSSRLFLFARTKGHKVDAVPRFTLQTMDGDQISFPETGECSKVEGWLALTADLPPGIHVLEQEVPELGRRAQVVFTEEGWETQIFVPWRSIPDFARAMLVLRPLGSGFDPAWSRGYERIEAALESLVQGRPFLASRLLDDMLAGGKIEENPMLALVVSYHLVMQSSASYDRLRPILENLKGTLRNSPDAKLISFLVKLAGAPIDFSDLSRLPCFTEPLLFAVGTERVLKLAANAEAICPDDCDLAAISTRLTVGSAWTRWNSDLDAVEAKRHLQAELRSYLLRTRGVLHRKHSHQSVSEVSEEVPHSELISKVANDLELPQSVVRAAAVEIDQTRNNSLREPVLSLREAVLTKARVFFSSFPTGFAPVAIGLICIGVFVVCDRVLHMQIVDKTYVALRQSVDRWFTPGTPPFGSEKLRTIPRPSIDKNQLTRSLLVFDAAREAEKVEIWGASENAAKLLWRPKDDDLYDNVLTILLTTLKDKGQKVNDDSDDQLVTSLLAALKKRNQRAKYDSDDQPLMLLRSAYEYKPWEPKADLHDESPIALSVKLDPLVSPDRQCLVLVPDKHRVEIWRAVEDRLSENVSFVAPSEVRRLKFSEDSRHLTVIHAGGEVTLNALTGALQK